MTALMKAVFKEILLLILLIAPITLLFQLWTSIPATIPLHYGIDGVADRFGDKDTLLWFIPATIIFIYGILALAPFIDPKKRIRYDNSGYYAVRLISLLFIAVLFASYLFSLTGRFSFSRAISLLFMAFLVLAGNYLPTLKPNYFLGIRTPWTLESEQVWVSTHRFSGRLWVAGGLLGLLLTVFWPTQPPWISPGIVVALALVSVLYSYRSFSNKDVNK